MNPLIAKIASTAKDLVVTLFPAFIVSNTQTINRDTLRRSSFESYARFLYSRKKRLGKPITEEQITEMLDSLNKLFNTTCTKREFLSIVRKGKNR